MAGTYSPIYLEVNGVAMSVEAPTVVLGALRSPRQQPAQAGHKSLTLAEGIAMVVGTNVGAGILSLAYASRKAGFLPLLLWLVVVGVLSTISMLYVAETTQRTRAPLQLSGLARRYVGRAGAWVLFLAVAFNSLGSLIAYVTGSGKIISTLLDVSPALGTLVFFIPAAGVLYFGLKAIGRSKKYVGAAMLLMVGLLVLATFMHGDSRVARLVEGNWYFMIPLCNITVFCFSAQYVVPEMARGFALWPELLPRAIGWGMAITFLLLAVVPLSVISLTGLGQVTDVATIAWGQALGQWAVFTANVFALCAMLTSYWGLGCGYMNNLVDILRIRKAGAPGPRFVVLAIACLPPFLLAYHGVVPFVNAIYFCGAFAGTVLSIMPIFLLRAARSKGDHAPAWRCRVICHPAVQTCMLLTFTGSAVYAIASMVGWLPEGW
jgi:amino acid permease